MATLGTFMSETKIPVQLCVGDAAFELGALTLTFVASPGSDLTTLHLEVVHERLSADLADLLRAAADRIAAA